MRRPSKKPEYLRARLCRATGHELVRIAERCRDLQLLAGEISFCPAWVGSPPIACRVVA